MTVTVRPDAGGAYGALQVGGVDVLKFGSGSNGDALQAATQGDLSSYSKRTLTSSVATTSGTFVDFTGIPSWTKKITVMLNGVSTSGTSLVQVQAGTSGGVENTSYVGNAAVISGVNATGLASSATGFPSAWSSATSNRVSTFILTLQSGNTWMLSGTETSDVAGTSVVMLSGRKTLSGTLDRIRLTTVNGTDTFDAGSVSLLIEG